MSSRGVMDVYFVVFDNEGSQAIRGWQAAKILSYYGYKNIKVVYSRDLIGNEFAYIKYSIVIFIKDLHNHVSLKPLFLEKLKVT